SALHAKPILEWDRLGLTAELHVEVIWQQLGRKDIQPGGITLRLRKSCREKVSGQIRGHVCARLVLAYTAKTSIIQPLLQLGWFLGPSIFFLDEGPSGAGNGGCSGKGPHRFDHGGLVLRSPPLDIDRCRLHSLPPCLQRISFG